MAAPDFRELLSKKADTVEKPKPLPAGTYHGNIVGYEFDKSRLKETPFVRFLIKLVSADSDVDQELLQGIDLSKKQHRVEFYLTDDSEYRLVEFCQSCGIDKTGRSLAEIIEDCRGQPVMVSLVQNTSKDGMEIYSNIASIKGTA